MTNALIVQAQRLIREGDIAGAEYALVNLAETEGDYALVAVLEEMPPKDLLAVIREFDTSKESVVNLLVTPDQFARAVIIEKLYADPTHARLRGMMNAVLFRDDTKTSDFIEAIGELDGGYEAFVNYLADRDEEVAHFAEFDTFNVNFTEERDAVEKSEVADRDWKELTWLLKHEHEDIFEQVWPTLKRRAKERKRREAELERLEQEEGYEFGLGLDPEPAPTRHRPAAPKAPNKPSTPIDPSEESAL